MVAPSPVSVLCLLPDLDGGGAERTMVNLVNAMPGGLVDPYLVVARGDGPGRRWLDPNRAFTDLRARRTLSALPALARLAWKRRPEVLFSTMLDANILAALIGPPGCALVMRETNSHRARDDLSALRRAVGGWAYRRAARVVALSEGVRRELIGDCRLDPHRCVTLPNPVDVDDFAARAAHAKTLWPEALKPGAVPRLMAIGRLARQKGFDVLIDAFARHVPAPARLIILGEGPERTRLEALAAANGLAERIEFPGFVADPAVWLAHADLFVLSSRWEGFGHVIVEAMACGVPVLATACPHGPADIIADGRDGRLVPPEDSRALGQAIAELLANETQRNAFALAGRAKARQFALAAVARHYAVLLREAAGRGATEFG